MAVLQQRHARFKISQGVFMTSENRITKEMIKECIHNAKPNPNIEDISTESLPTNSNN
ncbi:hypothetical protein [Chitinimonas sp. BJB300]|uniref:hypothetical protein n=1 Tax=Chitinimonas sp. BJB300 TaxID=1559339 RepID=UPI0013045F76|nr:hypothetical protein [Chitinimonas sp. BJB300]